MPSNLTWGLTLVLGVFSAVYLYPARKVTPMAVPTDPYEAMQYNMRNTHETYRLGFRTIIRHLDKPPMDDLDNFLGYVRAWANSIVEHHDSEEESLFLFLNTKLDFSEEIAQHVVVANGLTEILKYVDESVANHAVFDAAKLKNMMETLEGPLFEHLDQEVEDLAPAKMKVFTTEEISKAGKDLMVYIRAHSDKYTTLPYLRTHTPPELKEVWPPFPWFVKRVVVPWFLAPKHAGYWKYAPYSVY
ncbi:hypothetical protein FB45DRAFT_909731 [Roridomyces roridus]|uniref:Hemerythrin-like domain-containing protein n=1 Tax=Roridomyces roridus TaxID=1738132 RepID=A0AAD7BZ75_9AGAR|nr:hypothetical protein FB45DRAFT_909731 [Roridomyces roridus]